MNIKEWLAENAKTRRNKYALLLGLVLFTCVMLVGLYQLYRNIDNLETTIHKNIVVLTSQEVQIINVHHAQTAFYLQVQAWRDVMLHGHDAQGRQTNFSSFLDEEAHVRKALETMYAAALGAHEEEKALGLKTLLELHQVLGKRYRNAIAMASLGRQSISNSSSP